MRYALSVEPGDAELDIKGLPNVTDLTLFCAGQVVVDLKSNRITLVHPTIQEYIDKVKLALFPTAHQEIANTCMTYLRMDTSRSSKTLSDFLRRLGGNPLLHYAASYWGFHVRLGGGNEDQNKLVLEMLDDDAARAFTACAVCLKTRRVWFEGSHAVHAKSFHLAAFFGLIGVFEELDHIGTPLHWAILGKQDAMIRFCSHMGHIRTLLRVEST